MKLSTMVNIKGMTKLLLIMHVIRQNMFLKLKIYFYERCTKNLHHIWYKWYDCQYHTRELSQSGILRVPPESE